MIWEKMEKMWTRMQLKVRTCVQVKHLEPWDGAALVVAVDVSFEAPTVPASIAFWARVKARPFTEIEQVIWNVD